MPQRYTLAFGPFAPPWRNPQRLVLSVEGDIVTDVVYHGGYNERGCAERMGRLPLLSALHLAARICGMSSHAHTLAFCQAWEALAGLGIPPRAAYLRSIVAEIERISSHCSTLAMLFETLGCTSYSHALRQVGEQSRTALALISGRRIIPDFCVPGGVQKNLDQEQQAHLLEHFTGMQQQLTMVVERVSHDSALAGRTVGVGSLSTTIVEQFGLGGTLARAAGLAGDARIHHPYAAYGAVGLTEVLESGSDVYARIIVLLLETLESATYLEKALLQLPHGDWQVQCPDELPAGRASSSVESPYGTLRYSLESDGRRVMDVAIEPPRPLDRLLARALLTGALLDNVVLIMLSTNVSIASSEG